MRITAQPALNADLDIRSQSTKHSGMSPQAHTIQIRQDPDVVNSRTRHTVTRGFSILLHCPHLLALGLMEAASSSKF